MKKLLFSLLFLSGCAGQSHVKFDSTELWGKAADTYAQQLADNMATTSSRFNDLFQYNSVIFVALFATMLAGIAFMVLTRSKWGWVIPAVAGSGIASLIFITQAIEYAPYIVLGTIGIAVVLLLWKVWQYQKERNQLIAEKK